MIQHLPYEETEMCHGSFDLYMTKSEEFLSTPDDSDIGYFIEVDLRYPHIIKKNKGVSILSRKYCYS